MDMTSKNATLLWVDDDSPKDPINLEGATIVPAKSIGAAESILGARSFSPDGVIVDLIIPQGTWKRERYLQAPGIDYAGVLRERLGHDFPLAAYGICITPENREELDRRGVSSVYEKTKHSLLEVARKLLRSSSAKVDVGGSCENNQKMDQV